MAEELRIEKEGHIGMKNNLVWFIIVFLAIGGIASFYWFIKQPASSALDQTSVPEPTMSLKEIAAPIPEIPTSFEQELATRQKLIVVDFYADWCPMCVAVEPEYAAVAAMPEFKEKVLFYKADVEKQATLAQDYEVQALPTFVLFKDGKKVDAIVGFRKAPELAHLISQQLNQ